MEFAKPQKFSARVSEKYYLSDNEHFLYVRFELVTPDRMSFQAGQYLSFALPEGGLRRSYSMATTPDNTHGFAIVAEMVEGGKGTTYLQNLAIGDSVEVLGPLGRFVTHVEDPKQFLFVATGAGIVPISSMIHDLLINQHETRQIRLHWGLRSEAHMFWFDNFERLMETYPNFVFDPVLSQPGESWSLCSGHVQDCLQRDFAQSKLADWQGYVCGNPKMVEELSGVLTTLGMDPAVIHHEKFV
jgi:NAD(P)H-flavin reductase